ERAPPVGAHALRNLGTQNLVRPGVVVDRVARDDAVLPQPPGIEPDRARLGVMDFRRNQRALLQTETARLSLLADFLQRLADGIRSDHVPLSLSPHFPVRRLR